MLAMKFLAIADRRLKKPSAAGFVVGGSMVGEFRRVASHQGHDIAVEEAIPRRRKIQEGIPYSPHSVRSIRALFRWRGNHPCTTNDNFRIGPHYARRRQG